MLLCPDCEVIRTSRSRHCSTCGHCVERFDHHCPWINNCVGIGNHHYFMAFLISVIIMLIVALITGLKIINFFQNNEQPVFGDCFLDIIPPSFFNNTGFIISNVVIVVLSIFFFLPVLVLSFVQLKNFCLNKTTSERFGRRNKKNHDTSSSKSSFQSGNLRSSQKSRLTVS